MHSPDDQGDKRRVGWLLPAAYLILLAVGVPWYWPEGDTTLWFGMPAWIVTAIAASSAVSVLTAIVLRRPWPEETESPREEEPR
jgi:hypothetical protein